ncbi:hypothetical protein HPP92_018428 [Vanilla planifolia]|uniref:Late embryogenesis abundant protein LEA-2 subgroup domain-containing protein n=1 Tax=Vanilla planifolia TaxID=51239 RepID=A0A835Q9S6_VANPL|nr:hypothetical protein HPP92_018428 [Vanilla planifolia]
MKESPLPLAARPSPSTGQTPNGAKPSLLRRRLRPLLLCLLVLLLLLFAAVLTLALLLRPHSPRIQLVSTTVSGISPSLSLPALRLSLNLTLTLDILVYNPNRASFSHATGTTALFYRSAHVGDADVLPGRIPSRGSAHVALEMTVDGTRLAAEAGNLLADAIAGEVALEANARIPGRVRILGLIRHHAVAESDCHVVIGFPNLRVKRQDCSHHTKL